MRIRQALISSRLPRANGLRKSTTNWPSRKSSQMGEFTQLLAERLLQYGLSRARMQYLVHKSELCSQIDDLMQATASSAETKWRIDKVAGRGVEMPTDVFKYRKWSFTALPCPYKHARSFLELVSGFLRSLSSAGFGNRTVLS